MYTGVYKDCPLYKGAPDPMRLHRPSAFFGGWIEDKPKPNGLYRVGVGPRYADNSGGLDGGTP